MKLGFKSGQMLRRFILQHLKTITAKYWGVFSSLFSLFFLQSYFNNSIQTPSWTLFQTIITPDGPFYLYAI